MSITAGFRRRLSLRQHIGGLTGMALLMVIGLAGLLANVLPIADPLQQSLGDSGLPPFWMEGGSTAHLFGTDDLGRDLLSRIIHGARVSMIVGLATVLIQTLLGVLLGLMAGYFGGPLEAVIMRLADVWLAIPFLVLALAIMAITGPGLGNTILVLGLTGWVTFARVVRGEVLAVKEREFVEAARSMGSPSWRIIGEHIIGNVSGSIIVIATLQISHMIVIEASLSFLGLGVQPPTPAWGSMIAQGRDYLFNQWWYATLPGVALMLTALSINLMGDTLRDILDPRLHREQ